MIILFIYNDFLINIIKSKSIRNNLLFVNNKFKIEF